MAYFPDLAPYAYACRRQTGVVHVGWLDATHPFPTGVPASIVETLKAMAEDPVELCRGYHLCEMCQPPPEARLEKIPNYAVLRPNERGRNGRSRERATGRFA